jgi:phosphate transport system substrate-binding protein
MKSGSFILLTGLATFIIGFLPGNGISEELVIVGTGAGMTVLEAVGKTFTEKNPEISIVVPKSIGSGGGIKAVGTDAYIIGRVARDISEREKRYGLIQHPLAKLPIVFYINESVSIENLTFEQACSIYSGESRKWEDIGGGQGPIRVIRREDGDSSLQVFFNTLPGFKAIIQTRISKVTYTDQETIKNCVHQENSIAYGTLSNVKNISGIRILSLGNRSPFKNGYPHVGPIDLVYKKKNYSGSLKKFIEFIPSDAATKAIIKAGALPAK